MTRDITAAVLAQIEASASTPAHLLKLEMQSGTIYYYTDAPRHIDYDGHVWEPETFDFTAISANQSNTILSCQLSFGGPNHPVSAIFVAAGGGTGHKVTLWEGLLDAARDVIANPLTLISGHITRVQRKHTGMSITIEQDAILWKATIPSQIISDSQCQYIFNYHGDASDKSLVSWSAANPSIVTYYAHGLEAGDKIYVSGCGGADAADVNALYWTVTKLTADTFSVPVDLSGKTVTGGTAVKQRANGEECQYAGDTITGITAANPAVVTSTAHHFVIGDTVYFRNVAGMVEINGLTGTVTAKNANDFTVNIDASAFTAYTSGGKAMHTWCNKTAARCTTLGNTLHAGYYPHAVAPGEIISFGTGYDSDATDRADDIQPSQASGHLGIVKGGGATI